MNNSIYEIHEKNSDGAKLRDDIETYVAARNIEKLQQIDKLLVECIAQGIQDEEISYIDLDEYVAHAVEQLTVGVDTKTILESPLRKNMYM